MGLVVMRKFTIGSTQLVMPLSCLLLACNRSGIQIPTALR